MRQPPVEPHDEPSTAARGAPGDGVLFALATGAAAVTLCVVFWPLATRRLFLYADLGNFCLPIRMFWAENLAAGRPSLWMPNLFCGFYFHGEGQTGMYHPLRWLLYRTLPVDVAFALECVASYPVLLLGTYLLFRRRDLPRAAATFGAIVFAFSGFVMVRLAHMGPVQVIAHVPWLLWAMDVVFREPPGRARNLALAALAALTASAALVGYPGALFFVAMFEGTYAAFLVVRERRVAPLGWVAAASLAGLAAGAVQLLPTFEFLGDSLRPAFSFEERALESLHPLNLLVALAPWLFRDRVYEASGLFNPIEQAFYLGAVVPVAAVWVAVRRKALGERRGFALGTIVVGLVALAVALGKYGWGFRLVTAVPLLGLTRVPSRYTLFFYFAGALVAALAFADLMRTPALPDAAARRRAWWLWSAPAASLLIAVAALVVRRAPPAFLPAGTGPAIASTGWVLLGPALSIVAAALFFAAARGRRAALAGIVLFTLADQAAYGASLWWNVPPATLAEYVAAVPRPPVEPPARMAADHSVAIWRDETTGHAVFKATTPMIVHGTKLADGYAGLEPARRLPPATPVALRIAEVAVGYVGGRYYRLPEPLPRARLVARVQTTDDVARDVAAVDVATTALVDAPVDVVDGPPGRVAIAQDLPGLIALEARAETRQLLVLSESFHRGWRVAVDGEERPVLRVYGDYMGCVVDPGRHRVVFRFDPASFRIGWWVSVAGAGLILAGTIVAGRAS